MNVESQIIDIIEGKKSAPVAKTVLQIMSQCYRAGVSARNLAYDAFLPSQTLPLKVVSIGNIVAGGTGKTPFVHYLAKRLLPYLKVAILSRGYRRQGKKSHIVDEKTTVEEAGDEPYLLAQKLPDARVIVGANRVSTGLQAGILGAQIALLDDGMQHRFLARDVEIVVMHASDLFGKGYYLPRGFLRDSPRRLAEADQIILMGVKSSKEYAKQSDRIRKYTNAPITAMELILENPQKIANKKVASFCALAKPKRFASTLKECSAQIILQLEKPDHFAFTQEELSDFSDKAKKAGAEALVCTEKDAVKLSPKLSLSLPIVPLAITLKPSYGKEELETLISHIVEDYQ